MTNTDTKGDKKGKLFVISGPSGVGKGTLVEMLRKKHPQIALSVSATTRRPRRGEVDGVHYFFITKDEFLIRVGLGEFIEWSEFAGNYYGTNRRFVQNMMTEGFDILLEIDVKGALQVKMQLPEAVLIFIEPPSIEELQKRLFKRKTESEEEIFRRLIVVKSEFELKEEFDYRILNDNIDKAYKRLEEIIVSEIQGIKKNACRDNAF